MGKLRSWLVLIRPANVVTSIADVLAGACIAGLHADNFDQFVPGIFLLVLSSACLYAGGIVFNDYFDFDLDLVERPERMLPSGKISRSQAFTLGIILVNLGVLLALTFSVVSGILAATIASTAVLYDKWGKHKRTLGPLLMGLCRACNLLLGLSLVASSLTQFWWIGIIPMAFIFAITLASQGEVHAGNRIDLVKAMVLDLVVIFLLIYVALRYSAEALPMLLMVAVWAFWNLSAKFKAWQDNSSVNIQRAVKYGVLSLIPMDAAYAAGFSDLAMLLIILGLLPFSFWLARQFAVT